jgi:hypothetical protein
MTDPETNQTRNQNGCERKGDMFLNLINDEQIQVRQRDLLRDAQREQLAKATQPERNESQGRIWARILTVFFVC